MRRNLSNPSKYYNPNSANKIGYTSKLSEITNNPDVYQYWLTYALGTVVGHQFYLMAMGNDTVGYEGIGKDAAAKLLWKSMPELQTSSDIKENATNFAQVLQKNASSKELPSVLASLKETDFIE